MAQILYNCSNQEFIDSFNGQVGTKIDLVEADPPWSYQNTGSPNKGFKGTAKQVYSTSSMEDIARDLNALSTCTHENSILLLWATFPLLMDLGSKLNPLIEDVWTYKSTIVWDKQNVGVGFWFRSRAEMCLVFRRTTKGKSIPPELEEQMRKNAMSQLFTEKPVRYKANQAHSHKPLQMLTELIRRFTLPGATVLSLWAGMFPTGRACHALGINCYGVELDPERFAIAQRLLNGQNSIVAEDSDEGEDFPGRDST